MMNEWIIVYHYLYTFHWFIDPLETFKHPRINKGLLQLCFRLMRDFLKAKKPIQDMATGPP